MPIVPEFNRAPVNFNISILIWPCTMMCQDIAFFANTSFFQIIAYFI